jgi:hypothetical protein
LLQIKNGISFKSFYSLATDGDGTFIAYLYNKTTFTGYLNGLEKGADYKFCCTILERMHTLKPVPARQKQAVSGYRKSLTAAIGCSLPKNFEIVS